MSALDNARAKIARAQAQLDAFESVTRVALTLERDEVAALITEHERVTAPPTDDDLPTLAKAILDADASLPLGAMSLPEWSERLGAAVLSAGFRHRGPVTDAEVEAALRKWCGPTEALWREGARADMRAALEAARGVQS